MTQPCELIPRQFFITSGKAVSPVSELNAFDLALEKAGIAQCNLVPVSSILPPNCPEIQPKPIAPGSITFTVLARMDGHEGTLIGTGLAWAWETYKRYGLVAETHGHMDCSALEEILKWKITEMAKIRGIEINGTSYRYEDLRVPMDQYGCVIVALVYVL